MSNSSSSVAVLQSPSSGSPVSIGGFSSSSSSSSLSSASPLSRGQSLEQMAVIAQAQQQQLQLQQQILAAQQQQKEHHDFVKQEERSISGSASVGDSISSSSSSSSTPSSSAAQHAAGPSAGSTVASSSSSPVDPHKRIRASKNKQKHNESESRRRDRLRTQFLALRSAADCEKKDRIAILAAATERLRQQEQRCRQYEQEREMLITQLNAANLQLARAHALGSSFPSSSSASLSSLVKKDLQQHLLHDAGSDALLGSLGKLLSGQLPFLSHLPAAFIGLDGKFLDFNAAFVQLTGFSPEFLLSSNIFAVSSQHELTQTFYQMKRLLACELDCWEADRTCTTADGSSVPVHLTMTVTKLPHSKPEYFTCFFVLKEGAAAVAAAAAAAATAANIASNTAAAVAHHHHQQQQQQQQLGVPGMLSLGVGGGPMNVVLGNPGQLTSLASANSLSLLSSPSSSHQPHPHPHAMNPHAGLQQLQLPMTAMQPQQRFDTNPAFQSFQMQPHM